MEKANELLKLVREDSDLERKSNIGFNSLIDASRKNQYCKKLSMLARNSNSAKDAIVENISDLSSDEKNDFRIFSLLIVLADSNRFDEASNLSRGLLNNDTLSATKTIALNILLRESMYGNRC